MARLFKTFRETRDVSVVPSTLWRNGTFGTVTPTGLSITPDTAMTVTSYFAAVRFRAFAVASLPKIIYQRIQGGDKRRAVDHPLYRILHDTPNAEMSAFDLWSTLDSHVLVRGNAYAEIVSDRAGNVTGLWPLRPDKMTVTRDEDGNLLYLYKMPAQTGMDYQPLLPEQVLHLRGLTTDGVMGLAPITLMRNAVGLAKATEEYGSAYFGNGANPGVVLKHPNKFKDQLAYDRLKNSWEESHRGIDQAHRVAILEEGMSVERIGLSPEDSQFLETRVHQVYEISRMTDVPPQMIFELSQSNYSTLEQMTLDFVVHHLRPWLVAYEQQCNRSLLLESEQSQGYFVENLIDGLLRGDLATRYNAYSIGKQNGWLSTNDIRRMENMNTIGKKGDGYMVPLNMSVLGDDGMPVPTPETVPAKEPNTPARNNPVPVPQLNMLPLLRDAAERIGKRELNEYTNARKKYTPKKFEAWAEEFYKRDYPAFMSTVLQPFIDAGLIEQKNCNEAIKQYCDHRGRLAVSEDAGVYVAAEIVDLFYSEEQSHE